MRMSTTATSGRWLRTLSRSSPASRAWPTTSNPASASRRARPSRSRVASSAITARTARPFSASGKLRSDVGSAAGGALPLERALERLDAIAEPAQSRAGWVRAADAVVCDLDEHMPVGARGADARFARLGVLDDVRERFGGDEVGGRFDRLRQSLAELYVEVDP